MGYHSKEKIQAEYDWTVNNACITCDNHREEGFRFSNLKAKIQQLQGEIDAFKKQCDVQGADYNLNKLQDRINTLEKQYNVQSNNYELCDADKKALSISFTNHKTNSQIELNKLQDQVEILKTSLLQANNSLKDSTKKA